MKALLVIAIVVVLPALVRPSTIEETLAAPRPPPPPSYETITFDLGKPNKYSATVESLRGKLATKGSKACNIQVTPSRETIEDVSERYVLVYLKTTVENLVYTLAIDVTNLYVVAYRDNNGVAYFFKKPERREERNWEDYQVAKENLFKGTHKTEMRFRERYEDMETAAQVPEGRQKIELGVLQLEKAIINVNTNNDDKNKARFLLIATQMVSEAARFQYIVNKVVNNVNFGYKPDVTAISLETKWNKLSKRILKSDKAEHGRCTKIDQPNPIEIDIGPKQKWEVKTVDEVRKYLKIINFNAKDEDNNEQSTRSISQFTQIISSIVAQDDEAAFAIVEAGNL